MYAPGHHQLQNKASSSDYGHVTPNHKTQEIQLMLVPLTSLQGADVTHTVGKAQSSEDKGTAITVRDLSWMSDGLDYVSGLSAGSCLFSRAAVSLGQPDIQQTLRKRVGKFYNKSQQ